MAATAIERPRTHVHCDHLAAALRAAHREVATVAAELDPADARLWAAVDPVLSEATAAAHAMATALTGAAPPTPASNLPPTARLRELAAAHQRLDAALDLVDTRPPGPLVVQARQSVDRVATLSGWLRALASTHSA